MSIFTQSEIDEQISAYKQALMAVSVHQEYLVAGRRFTHADLPEIRKTLEWLDAERSRISLGMSRGPQYVETRLKR